MSATPCTNAPGCTCFCCVGTSVQTPVQISNLPGLPAIQYRTGTWAGFKASMLARLSSTDYPALTPLKTRDDDDFSIAFLDAGAMVLDILTFYQERLANENYLRTATQLRSLTELTCLIAYQPAPGVSADTYLAFTLRTTPGLAPNPATQAITIPAGTQVQSVPAQGQTPVSFETSADIQAKPDWNALPVQAGQPWAPSVSATGLYLTGTTTQLQVGDYILILAPVSGPTYSLSWSLNCLTAVTADAVKQRTWISWAYGNATTSTSGTVTVSQAQQTPALFALRQRAALFGYNAVNPNLLNVTGPDSNLSSLVSASGTNISAIGTITAGTGAIFGVPSIITGTGNIIAGAGTITDGTFANASGTITITSGAGTITPGPGPIWAWNNYQLGAKPNQIDLDSSYPKILAGSWLVQMSSATPAPPNPILVNAVSFAARSDFGLSAKVTRIIPDPAWTGTGTGVFPSQTTILAQSEALHVAEQPFSYPLYGMQLDLEGLRPDLANITAVAISGNSQKIYVAVPPGANALSFVPDDNSAPTALNAGDLLTIISTAGLPLNTAAATPAAQAAGNSFPDWSVQTASQTLYVQDANGRTGTVFAALQDFTLTLAAATDPAVSETALVASVNTIPATADTPPFTRILLQSPLLNCYDRTTATVNANVGLATHGQSVTEILGSGAAATPSQFFNLKQSPLTFTQAPTATGRSSTLAVQVSGVTWTEVPSLYQQGPSQSVFATRNLPGGVTTLLFGDGEQGATLPTGVSNVQATYRIGLGSAGNVAAASLTTLIDRPLGVSGVTNPMAATGGQDAQTVAGIQANAPQTVLTLGRAVSVLDYQTLASGFAGIAKAAAVWIPSGPQYGVFLTVAGVNGAALPPGNPTLQNLILALRNCGNPLIPVAAATFLETLFGLTAQIKYDPSYSQQVVTAQVQSALAVQFGFANRNFGQSVTADAVAATMQAVPGVIAVNVTALTAGAITSAGGDLASEGASFSLSRYNQWVAAAVPMPPRPASPSDTIIPYPPSTSAATPAELLVINPDPGQIVLGVMP